ncbi:uncharacterized protein LOC122884916 isoform X2 [Siniperca chuatsi]|uniref:uncharacterized protein LOC122884916 isoform X2 n=1 Tax=Siniperca chuatsi TaxID=119488 RepID=UPI001CE06340|nr:uncharacterized protein LOC122884916 isoform X2 [Siniperca chuatsi]
MDVKASVVAMFCLQMTASTEDFFRPDEDRRRTEQTSSMGNCDVPIRDHDKQRARRTSGRWAQSAWKPGAYSKCPCCRGSQVPNLNPKRQHSACTGNLPQKRKRTSVARPSKPAPEHPEVLNWVPTPQPSTPAADIPGLLNLVPRPQSTNPPADLPVVSNVAPSPPLLRCSMTEPLKIRNRSVEDYQQIYHEVADDMLSFYHPTAAPASTCRFWMTATYISPPTASEVPRSIHPYNLHLHLHLQIVADS